MIHAHARVLLRAGGLVVLLAVARDVCRCASALIASVPVGCAIGFQSVKRGE